MIAFVGSVFSPYYAWNRRRGAGNPTNHCAFNVALYGPRHGRWSMTDRSASQLQRDASRLRIGPSEMMWNGNALDIVIDEIGAPWPRRIRGNVKVTPSATCERSFALDPEGHHHWTPLAPCSRIEATFSSPRLTWTGGGYVDSNVGDEPLENAFSHWSWSRSSSGSSSVVLYDVTTRDLVDRSLAIKFAPDGTMEFPEAPPRIALPRTGWRVARDTRADAGTDARVIDTLEDTPFYSRSLLDTQVYGQRAPAFHESLNLNRFRSPWVQCLLPFRMPRKAR